MGKHKSRRKKYKTLPFLCIFYALVFLCFDKLHVKSLIIYNSSYFIQQFMPQKKHSNKLRKSNSNKKKKQKTKYKMKYNLLVYVISCWLCLALHSLTHSPKQQNNSNKRNINLTHPHVCAVIILWVIILSSHSSLFQPRCNASRLCLFG